jgi:hypothetical protein
VAEVVHQKDRRHASAPKLALEHVSADQGGRELLEFAAAVRLQFDVLIATL